MEAWKSELASSAQICAKVSSPCSSVPESAAAAATNAYSRKQKSLGLLCSNFLGLYNQEGVESIGLDDAASRLGVERRRIYDIVNVLESVGILARKAKNQYSWKGFGAMPKTLDALKEEGLRENYNMLDFSNCSKVSDDEDESISNPNTSSQQDKSNSSSTNFSPSSLKIDNRREKSLGLLTQNFVKLFLCSNVDLISLDEAARILLGDGHSSATMKSNSAAKVRRLYDIANVLSSMNLIEKTHHPETRKPAFRWLGMTEKTGYQYADTLEPIESKKRTFGTEITNGNFKRKKVDYKFGKNASKLQLKMQMQMKQEVLENGPDGISMEQVSRQSLQTYKFGPFAPVGLPMASASGSNSMKLVHDWETLSSAHRPQYHNQALKDLFVHYMEAWKSWYLEVAGEMPMQQIL